MKLWSDKFTYVPSSEKQTGQQEDSLRGPKNTCKKWQGDKNAQTADGSQVIAQGQKSRYNAA